MAGASCSERAGTGLGTTEAAAGAERQKQDVKIAAAAVATWDVLWLPRTFSGYLGIIGEICFFKKKCL